MDDGGRPGREGTGSLAVTPSIGHTCSMLLSRSVGRFLGGSLGLVLLACGPSTVPVGSSGGSGGTDSSGDLGTGEDETGDPGLDPVPPRGLRLAVHRLTGTDWSYDGGTTRRGYPGRVELVEWVAGGVSSVPLIESIDCHWDGRIQCPDVSTSNEGWLALTYATGGQVAVDEAVWTFDARDLLPSVPPVGRVIPRSELTEDPSWVRADVVGEWLALVRSQSEGLDVASVVGDEPPEGLGSSAIRARPIPGTEALVHRDGGVYVTQLDTGAATRIDDPELPSDTGPFEVSEDGRVVVFSEIDEALGVYSMVAVPLSDGVPGPPEDLGSMLSSETLPLYLSIAPDGGAAWWQHIEIVEGQPMPSYVQEYVGLGGSAPTQAMPLETDRPAQWSAATGSLVFQIPDEDAFTFLNRTNLESTRVELPVPLGSTWQPCGPGVVFESTEPLGSDEAPLHWVGLDGRSELLSSVSTHWSCSPEDDYLAHVSGTELYVRRLTPAGLGEAELVVSLAAEHYFGALEISADGSTLVHVDCPPFVSGWPPRTCPGVLSAWDVETSTSAVLLDDHYILVSELVPLALPPVGG